jgi:hypothetical protein
MSQLPSGLPELPIPRRDLSQQIHHEVGGWSGKGKELEAKKYQLNNRFIGNGGKRRETQEWPQKLIARIIAYTQHYSARDAMIAAVDQWNHEHPEHQMEVKHSYLTYSANMLWAMKKRFNTRLIKGDPETIEAAREYNLLDEASQEETPPMTKEEEEAFKNKNLTGGGGS